MLPVSREIIDIIDNVADNMRSVNAINNITLLSGSTYQVEFIDDNVYQIDEYLTLYDNTNTYENVKVLTIVDTKTITVETLNNNDLTLALTAKQNAPYYSFANWKGEAVELLLKDQTIKNRQQKYPLIFLLETIKQDRTVKALYSKIPNLDIFLIINTDPTKDSKWRHENTMPILRELYRNFIAEFTSNRYLANTYLEHEYEELPYLGNQPKTQNKVNDYVDAIRLTFRNINILSNKNC